LKPAQLFHRAVPEDPDCLVHLDEVSLAFDKRTVLEQISFAVRAGEILTLIGPNGTGKTTLAKIMLGLIKPDRGEVLKRPNLTYGYVPQRIAIDRTLPLTVSGFLNLPRRKSPQEISSCLAEVGAEALFEQPLHALSGGELQRVLLARAIMRDPDLLILDEPLQGVDFGGQLSLFQLIRELRDRRGCGVLLISHDLHLVMAGTDKVVCINRHVCCSGAPEAVSRHPEYLELFGSQAAKGLAVYSHHHDHSHGVSGEIIAPETPRETLKEAGSEGGLSDAPDPGQGGRKSR
jgi:zinc transport system ATP-binding protein